MNNAEFFGDGLVPAFRTWQKHVPVRPTFDAELEELAHFASLQCSTALEYDIGEIVRDVDHYYKVVGYASSDPGVLDQLKLASSTNGESAFYVPEMNSGRFKADLPEELVEFIIGKYGPKCPFAGKDRK